MRNVSDKSCRKNQNTHFEWFFFRKWFRLWRNVEKYNRTGQATDDNMAHAHCLLDKRLRTQSEKVIIVAFPLQRRLHERALMLRFSALPAFLNSS
jgi:hypothetical protein